MKAEVRRLFCQSQLRQNVLSGIFAAGLQTGSNLIAYPVYLHLLGYEQYGIWLTLATLISLMQLGIAGIGPAVSQLVADACARNDPHKLGSYVTWPAILTLALTAVLATAGYVFAPSVVALLSLPPQAARTAISLIPLVALLSGYFLWVDLFSSVLSGLGRMDQSNLVNAVGPCISVLVAVLLLRRGMGITALIAGYFAGRSVVFSSVLLLIRRRYPGPIYVKDLRTAELRTFIKVSGSIAGGTFLNLFLSPFNKWIIAATVGVAGVPVYEIAFGSSMQLRSFVEVGLRALVPEISRTNALRGAEAEARIRDLIRKSLIFTVLAGTPIYLTAGFFAHEIFGVWLHRLLQPTQVTAFRILLIASAINLLATPAYYCLIGLQELRAVVQSYLVQVSLNVAVVLGVLVGGQVTVSRICGAAAFGIVSASIYLVARLNKRLKPAATEPEPGVLTLEAS